MKRPRETFTSAFGLLMTMIGVAVGLGAVWRFPYMVGKFGGAAFVKPLPASRVPNEREITLIQRGERNVDSETPPCA